MKYRLWRILMRRKIFRYIKQLFRKYKIGKEYWIANKYDLDFVPVYFVD